MQHYTARESFVGATVELGDKGTTNLDRNSNMFFNNQNPLFEGGAEGGGGEAGREGGGEGKGEEMDLTSTSTTGAAKPPSKPSKPRPTKP